MSETKPDKTEEASSDETREASQEPSDASSGAASEEQANIAPVPVESPTEPPDASRSGSAPPSKKEGKLWPWLLGVGFVLAAEMFIYGHNGKITVCVGHRDHTDYSLIGQERTAENASRIPFCGERLNLGMYGAKDDLAKEALGTACSMATRIVGRQQYDACIRKDGKWSRHVDFEQIPPWDSRLLKRLLWLD